MKLTLITFAMIVLFIITAYIHNKTMIMLFPIFLLGVIGYLIFLALESQNKSKNENSDTTKTDKEIKE